MSGGHFDYKQHKIRDILENIEGLIRSNDDTTLNEWGVPRGHQFSPEVMDEFKKAHFYLKRAYIYAHQIDLLICGDTGEETFLKRLKAQLEEENENL